MKLALYIYNKMPSVILRKREFEEATAAAAAKTSN